MEFLADELESRLVKLPYYGQDKFLFALEYALGHVQLDKHELSVLDKSRRQLYDFMVSSIRKRLDKEKARKWQNKKLMDECVTYLNLMRDFNEFRPNFSDGIMIGQMAVLKKINIILITNETPYSATIYNPNHTRLQPDNTVFLIEGYSDAFDYPVKITPNVLEFIRKNKSEGIEFSTYYTFSVELGPLFQTVSSSTKHRLTKQHYPHNLVTSHTRKSIPSNNWKSVTSLKNWKSQSQRQSQSQPQNRPKRERSRIVSSVPLFTKAKSNPFGKRYNKPPTIHRTPIMISNNQVTLENIEVPNEHVEVELEFKNDGIGNKGTNKVSGKKNLKTHRSQNERV